MLLYWDEILAENENLPSWYPAMGITNTRSKLDNAAIEEAIEALKGENECLRMEIDYLKS